MTAAPKGGRRPRPKARPA